MDVDLSNFEKEDFSINGFYRALVEDNADPESGGRVRVRILGIHSMDMLEAPTENLPWAEPVLSLAHSGGAANQHIDFGVPNIPKTKYKPTPIVAPILMQMPLPVPTDAVNRASTELVTIPTHKDFAICNSGTGGHFSVPAKGSLVWIFFDGGCHLRPQYFAMATQQRDWQAQKLKVFGELTDRDASISKLDGLLATGLDPVPHKFTSIAAAPALPISTDLKPPISIPEAPAFLIGTKTENISSWTSPGGTTIFADHTWRNEQLYIMHKGYSQHIAANGQVTKIVGSTSIAPVTPQTSLNPINAAGLPNDETEINAGLKNLYIVGDYNLFVLGSCNIQCFKNVTINANADVGVVSRKGNVNVLAELGSINLESTKGSVNIKGINVQIEADSNITLKSKKLIDLNSLLDINLSAIKSINTEASAISNNAKLNFGIQGTSVNINSLGTSAFTTKTVSTISAGTLNVNGDATILINSKVIEAKGAASLNLEAPSVNVKGATVSVNADGVVNILGATANVFGTAAAMVGGAATTIGGASTTLTGIVSLGLGAVVPAAPALNVSQVYAPLTVLPIKPLVPTPIIPSTPGLKFPPYVSPIIV